MMVLILVSSLLAEEKTLTLTKTNQSIAIDGFIDDTEWSGSSIADEFFEIMPGENVNPSVKTIIYITYDDEQLFVGYKAQDNPDDIRANISKRDEIYEDDMVGIMLDPQNTEVMAYSFSCNPFGNQADMQKVNQKENDSWDAVWSSAGRITESGFEVEMAIPFSSIRIPNVQDHHWRVSFWRVVPHADSRRVISWVPFNRDNPCELCQMGHLYGIENIRSRMPIEILPSAVSSYDSTLASDLGLGLKFPLGNSATAELSLNPDFSQVESDAARIDVNSSVALSYPETRPFFNEGMDLFGTGGRGWRPKVRTVYTRSINKPILAAKILGQWGRTQYGYLGAGDENTYLTIPFTEYSESVVVGESQSHTARVKRALTNGAYVSGLISQRSFGSGSGWLYGGDGLFRFAENYEFDWQIFLSQTIEPNDPSLTDSTVMAGEKFNNDKLTADFDGETFQGSATYLSFRRQGRNWGTSALYSDRSPTFRADNGFVQKNDQRRFNWNIHRTFYPDNQMIETLSFWLARGKIFDYDFVNWYEDWTYMSLEATLVGQTDIEINYMPSSEFYGGDTLRGNYKWSFDFDTKFSEMISFGSEFAFGREVIRDPDSPETGKIMEYGAKVQIKPRENIKIRSFLDYYQAVDEDTGEEYYSGFIGRLRCGYQFNKDINFRLVLQYDDFYDEMDVQYLVSYQPSPFTIFYIGSSKTYMKEDPNWEESFGQTYLKIQKLFSI